MNNKQESTMATIAALLVLFTTMLNPLISASLSVILLIAFAVYKYSQSKKD
jgi:hypothetical protein